jgi:hypothetical protein
MKKFVTVNKVLGNISHTSKRYWNTKEHCNFTVKRARFCKHLQNAGYKTFSIGNYITATKNNEENTFFFAAHRNGVSNYLIPVQLKYKVQYFAFYDEQKNCVYLVGYGKVREYTNAIETSYKFGISEYKMFVPDSWAKSQIINTYVF